MEVLEKDNGDRRPAIGTNLVVPVGIGLITALLANYGEYAVAAFGVASRVESLMLTVFMGLSAVIAFLL